MFAFSPVFSPLMFGFAHPRVHLFHVTLCSDVPFLDVGHGFLGADNMPFIFPCICTGLYVARSWFTFEFVDADMTVIKVVKCGLAIWLQQCQHRWKLSFASLAQKWCINYEWAHTCFVAVREGFGYCWNYLGGRKLVLFPGLEVTWKDLCQIKDLAVQGLWLIGSLRNHNCNNCNWRQIFD